MKTFSLFTFTLAAVLGLGTALTVRTDPRHQFPSSGETVAQTTDAAFRDGLYLGRLAAESGAESHIASGRWATLENRSSFTAGYQRGYGEFLASRVSPNTRGRRTE
jgi:hypothetical protein